MKLEKRRKAEDMRKRGESIRVIASSLNLSKSTVSLWCRNIELSGTQKTVLKQKQKTASNNALQKYRTKIKNDKNRRIIRYRLQGKKDVRKISNQEYFIAGLALYWGEGYKKSRGEVGFTNSDPIIIQTTLHWFMRFYKIEKKDFILRVSINKLHEYRAREVERYWSEIAGIPLTQFTKISLIKTAQRKIYGNMREHFGTLRVKVRRGTNLLERIKGAITELGVQTAK
ncbi:MAG: helix-turn-helix domain-containing protein [Candidatus Pacebacteria bacterium]|nr:helix-turn-helix domain-containing protein [Candidatus Paceibacterota bacterium]